MTEQKPKTFAEQQLANARSDPRLKRDEKAMVADWREGVEALERVRGFAIFSIAEVHRSLEGHDARPTGDDQLEHVLWQRRQLAAAEIASDFAELNAMTLVGLLGALDSLVESLAPAAREMLIAVALSERLEDLRRDQPEVVAAVAEETIEAVRKAAIPISLEQLGKIDRARGAAPSAGKKFCATPTCRRQPSVRSPRRWTLPCLRSSPCDTYLSTTQHE